MKEHVITKIDELKDFFKNKPVFTVKDLKKYYRRIDPHFKESAFKWRIHDLMAFRPVPYSFRKRNKK